MNDICCAHPIHFVVHFSYVCFNLFDTLTILKCNKEFSIHNQAILNFFFFFRGPYTYVFAVRPAAKRKEISNLNESFHRGNVAKKFHINISKQFTFNCKCCRNRPLSLLFGNSGCTL